MKYTTLVLILLIVVSTNVTADSNTFKFFMVSKQSAQMLNESKKYYEDFLADCLTFAKENNHSKAEMACSNAIKSAKTESSINSTIAMAYAYNNRAIARVLASNKVGALDDLRKAKNYQELDIINNNLNRLTSQINQTN